MNPEEPCPTACAYHVEDLIFCVTCSECRQLSPGGAGRYQWFSCLHVEACIGRRCDSQTSPRTCAYEHLNPHVMVGECEDDIFGCPLWTQGLGPDMWGRLRSSIILACNLQHIRRCLVTLLPRATFDSSSTRSHTLSLSGMQPRHTSIAAAGGAQAVCFYDLTLGG